MTKSLKHQIVAYYVNNPDAAPGGVAKKFGAKSTSNIYQYRKEAAALRAKLKTETETETETETKIKTETRKGITQQQFKDVIEAIRARRLKETPVDTDTLIDERSKNYGQFIGIATLTRSLLGVMAGSKNGGHLAADQAEALHMIAHKTARILNGDQDLADSWDDIAGYAKLVADRLQGHAR